MVWSDCVNSPPLRGSAIMGCTAQLHLMVVYPGRISACDLHQGSFLEPTDLSCSGCFHHLYCVPLPRAARGQQHRHMCPCYLLQQRRAGYGGSSCTGRSWLLYFYFYFFFSKGSSISRSNLQLAQGSTFH